MIVLIFTFMVSKNPSVVVMLVTAKWKMLIIVLFESLTVVSVEVNTILYVKRPCSDSVFI